MFDFPNAPTLGQVFGSYTWDGQKWTQTPGASAPLNSPAFTGTPTAPTPAPGDNSTRVATTAFVTNAVPAASAATPLIDGTAAAGASAAWARGDHVHPTDTTRAAQSSLANYLPLTGGTLSGNLTISAGGMNVDGGVTVSSGSTVIGAGGFQLSTAGVDYISFGGGLGLIGFWWQSSVPGLHAMRNGTDLGIIAYQSDYRIKKDVTALPTMWDRVKALKPISYTHQDYSPPGYREAEPFMVGNDVEFWGFIAHELQDTLTGSAASGVKDQPDLIQSPNPWTVIATLTKALQEAIARIEALEGNMTP